MDSNSEMNRIIAMALFLLFPILLKLIKNNIDIKNPTHAPLEKVRIKAKNNSEGKIHENPFFSR